MLVFDDENLEVIFINGLKLEMQKIMKMLQPGGVPELVATEIRMESSLIFKIMGKDIYMDVKNQKQSVTSSIKATPVSSTSPN